MAYATIAGIGHYVPAECVTNAELERRLGEPIADWLVANVGIERRHIMAAHETTSDLALVVRGKLRRGDHVICCASGGGVTLAAALVRWTL